MLERGGIENKIKVYDESMGRGIADRRVGDIRGVFRRGLKSSPEKIESPYEVERDKVNFEEMD